MTLLPWLARRWRAGRVALPRSQPREFHIVVTEPGQHLVRFASVGGVAAAKAALLRLSAQLRPGSSDQEVLENRSGSHHRPAQNPVGGVLHGPRGCGKTLLAQALAGELNLPLYAVSGVELGQLRPEAGAAQLRELFALAALHAPCVVFIDNLDAFISPGTTPSSPGVPGGAGAHNLQQFISLLDDLSRKELRVVVLGTTRRLPRLDESLLRPDRLGRLIALTLPEPRERAEILALLAHAHPELDNLDLAALVARTEGYSGADLGALLDRLALHVGERQRTGPVNSPSLEPAELERALAERPPPERPSD